MSEKPKRQRKAVKAKKEDVVPEVAEKVNEPAPLTCEDVGCPCVEEGAGDEPTMEELPPITVSPEVAEFLRRTAAKLSEGAAGVPYSIEAVVADILETWVTIYQDDDEGGIERAMSEEPPDPEDPDFQDAFEGALA